MAVVDGIELDASVVAFIAARDGIDEAAARRQAIETLQLVAASRAARAQTAGEPEPELTDSRRTQLLRAARARLWLHTDFEPSRGPDAIDADDPLLQRARKTGAWVHPAIVRTCQLVVMPNTTDRDESTRIASDPAWIEEATRIATTLRERAVLHVPPGDPEACTLLGRLKSLSGQPADTRFVVQYEKESGFDLSACAERAADGTCTKPSLDPTWTATIGALEPPALTQPFSTQFGVHVTLVRGREPARTLDDPATDAFLRERVHPRWQRDQFVEYMKRLQAKRAVRVATEPSQ